MLSDRGNIFASVTMESKVTAALDWIRGDFVQVLVGRREHEGKIRLSKVGRGAGNRLHEPNSGSLSLRVKVRSWSGLPEGTLYATCMSWEILELIQVPGRVLEATLPNLTKMLHIQQAKTVKKANVVWPRFEDVTLARPKTTPIGGLLQSYKTKEKPMPKGCADGQAGEDEG